MSNKRIIKKREKRDEDPDRMSISCTAGQKRFLKRASKVQQLGVGRRGLSLAVLRGAIRHAEDVLGEKFDPDGEGEGS